MTTGRINFNCSYSLVCQKNPFIFLSISFHYGTEQLIDTIGLWTHPMDQSLWIGGWVTMIDRPMLCVSAASSGQMGLVKHHD